MKITSLREKLILYFLSLGISTIVVISLFVFYSTRSALMERTFDQLTSLRIAKKKQVETFFKDRIKDITLLAGSQDTRMMISMLNRTLDPASTGWRQDNHISESFSDYLRKYSLLSTDFSCITLYGSGGSWISGRFDHQNGTITSGFTLREPVTYLAEMGTDKNFLLKDLAVSVHTGFPALRMIAQLSDGPAGSPIHEGVLVMEIPVDALNAIMLNNNPESGLGKTGETYLIGDDFKMRSVSRFIPNSVLNTSVRTNSALDAFNGKEGYLITRDYRNIPVLSAFSKIDLPGLKWVILSEIDLQEAEIPVFRIRNSIILLSVMITLIYFGLVYLISLTITRPIIKLKDAAVNVGQGRYDINLPIATKDEIGALTESFNVMAVQIKEKTNELKQERIGRLRSVFDGEEIERQRLSRELHDGIGQYLIALKLRLESLYYKDSGQIKEQILELKDLFDNTIDEIRRISNNLMPSVLEVFGIIIALRNLCEETEEHSGINFEFRTTGDLDIINKNIKTYIFRIAQEAINNIVKHSGATKVLLTLTREKNRVILLIADNGKGFNTGKAAMERGNGLHNMQERVSLLNGSIEIESELTRGTKILVNIPIF